MKHLDNRVAVITGAAGALGRALAERCAAAGMRLVLSDVDEAALSAAAAGLVAGGAAVASMPADVSRLDDVKALAALAQSRFGAAHLVCNNAGVAPMGPVWETTAAEWDWVLGVNVRGVINGVQVFTPMLLGQDEGHIVNTASVAGLLSPPGMGAYAASKHAVVALSECLFHDLAKRGTRVHCSVLCPAYFPSGIADSAGSRPASLGNAGDKSAERRASEEGLRRAVESGRLSASDIAASVLDAVVAERFWILTHPKVLGAVRTRMEDILDARNPTDPMAREAPRSPGAPRA